MGMLHIFLSVETLNMFHGSIQGAQIMQPWSVNFSFSFFSFFFLLLIYPEPQNIDVAQTWLRPPGWPDRPKVSPGLCTLDQELPFGGRAHSAPW